MNDTRLLPDDPRLTAYALGELTGDERATVEAALRHNPALRVTVDEIRATAAQMEAALAAETFASPASVPAKTGIVIELNGHTPKPVNGRHATLQPAARTDRGPASQDVDTSYDFPRSRPRILRFPQFYYVVATVAAACFAVMVTLRDSPRARSKPVERTIRHEIVLMPTTPKPAEAPLIVASVPAPTEPNVATVGLPPVPPAALTQTAAPNETVPPWSGPANRPAFFAGDLTLIGQGKPALATVDGAKGGGEAGFRGAGRMTGGTESSTLLSSITAASGTVRADGSTMRAAQGTHTPQTLLGERADGGRGIAVTAVPLPAAPVFFDALTRPVTAPVVAAASPPAVVPNSANLTRQSGGAATMPGAGDVVVLSAFTVTADRAVGFAAASQQRIAGDQRGPPRQDDLPAPPTGAKFGRNTEAYSYIRDNEFVSAAHNQLSTFSIDVDTASYANVRRILEHGSPPPRDAVRIEEMLNYFPYRYTPPKGDAPFAATLEMAEAPWAPTHRLVRIGLKAREVSTAQRPAASLVFLLDVSGSMNQPNKLPLVQESLRLLVKKLRADDRVAIVTYAGNSGLALPSTPVAQSREILNALDALAPGGSTNGAMGIQLAYEIARANFVRNGINRVILCTDGDFNVGTTSEGELVRLIEEKATSGVFLTVLGFGMGNYKDATLEKLADKGNGNYGYIDTRREAEKLLVEQISSTLVTVAKDVKIQVEFNPANVSSYRLIGYENRLLRKEDFNNDSVDAGEIGAGHMVTALYEIVPIGAEDPRGGNVPPIDELRYSARGAVSSRLEMPSGKRDAHSNELLVVKVRYKKPDSLFSFPKTLEFPLLNASKAFASASADFRFAAAVAQFGMILRGSPHRGIASMRDVAAWAGSASTTPEDDPGGYRGEFLDLVRKAQTMME